MAKFKMNKMVEGATGKVGNMVFRQVGRTTLYTQAPERSAVTSEKQRSQRMRFKRAASYAKSCLADPALKAMYEARANGEEFLTAFNQALTDYMHAPKIDSVDLSGYAGQVGDVLVAQVFESVKVTQATVTITLADNSVLESGDAVLVADVFEYQYQATKLNAALPGTKITFTIGDKDGNTHTVSKML